MRKYPIPPEEFDEQRLAEEGSDFRCQRCQGRYPLADLTIEKMTGYRVCSNHTYSYTVPEIPLIEGASYADQAAYTTFMAGLIAEGKARGLGTRNLFADMKGIVSSTPSSPFTIHRGGASVVFVLNGIGFVEDDVLTADTPLITASAPAVTFGGTVSTFTVTASGSAPMGERQLRFNDVQIDVAALVVA